MISTFTPYFLKKLDAYQEIRRQDRRNRRPWLIEKSLLTWCGSQHEHLGSVWRYSDIKAHVMAQNINANELSHAIGNLESKNLIDTAGSNQDIYKFTESGIIMGEVLHSTQKPGSLVGYWIALNVFQLLIPILLLTAFISMVKEIVELVGLLI